jgi:putative phage-type endonuclease
MTAIAIPFTSREQWLRDRAQDVTSTESPALFGLSPYVTEFELWHRKHANTVEELEPNERILWGTRLQDTIAAGVAQDRGWCARRIDEYLRDEGARIGSSFDFEVVCPKLGRGLMEIKNVDRLVYLDEWVDRHDAIEAPQHIEMQVQHQMEVADMPWCAIVALVGGNEAKVQVRLRDREIGRLIRERVAAFWRSIADNRMPRPDYDRDAEFMARLYGRADAGVVLDADAETVDLLDEYDRLGDLIDKRDGIKARVLERIGRASKVLTPIGNLSVGMVEPSAGKEITPEMVGTRVGTRAGFRMFRFNRKKEKSK